MRRSAKLILTTATAAVVLAALVSTASARSLSISTESIRATWASLEFVNSLTEPVRCPVTLTGRFHSRTISKVVGALIGAITGGTVNQARCTNGTGAIFNGTERFNGTTTPNTLPWHITYLGFLGALPNINSVDIGLSRFRFGVASAGLTDCQYGGAETITGRATITSRAISALNPVGGRNIANKIGGNFFCPATGSLVGEGRVDNSAGSSVTITLI